VVGGGRDNRGLRPDHEAAAKRYQKGGYDGLYDRRKRRPSPKRTALKIAEKVQLYREKYFDFNVRHFHEKLAEEHGVQIS
jgi:hypothetical protein